MKDLIYDYNIFKPKSILQESTNGVGVMLVEGILTTVDKQNKNGRKYPRKIFEREVNKYIEEFVNEKRAYGELDHPDSTQVEGKNASHVITDIWWEGDHVMGRLELLDDNPAGRVVSNILKRGYRLGISSRGVGTTKRVVNEDCEEVGEDYELICWDFVTNPSNYGSFMNKVTESVLSEGSNQILTEQTNKHIDNIFHNIFCQWNQKCGLR